MVAANIPIDTYTIAERADHREAIIITNDVTDNTGAGWFSGIIAGNMQHQEESTYHIVDKGNCIEFVLPRGTAQFVQMHIRDTFGNLVWKTQAFNKKRIRWYKHSALGTKVPQGSYQFHLTQGTRQVKGVATISDKHIA